MQLTTELPKFTAPSRGKVLSVRGLVLTATLPQAAVGDLCYVHATERAEIPAMVVGFDENTVTLAPFSHLQGIAPGAQVKNSAKTPEVTVSDELLGHVVDCCGSIIDSRPLSNSKHAYKVSIYNAAPNPLTRERLLTHFNTGVASIDLFTPLAYGQRLGVLAPAGSGKSTLLGMIARNADIDCAVIGLIGERGREVREFIEDVLGVEGLKRSVVVVSTSDEPAIRRMLAPYTATAIAEYFRAKGKRVLLVIDSLTRTARAMREVGLSSGELPIRHGYPASVYAELPRLIERTGSNERGSITALYSVLSDQERELDPLSEEIQSLVDGQIRLSRDVALRGIRPAIDLTRSISRLATKILSPHEQLERRKIVSMLGRLERDRDIMLLGGTPDTELETLLKLEPRLRALCHQEIPERVNQCERVKEIKSLLAAVIP